MLALLVACLLLRSSCASPTTFVFSAGPNTYVAFDSWRPCLTGYVRFDIRTNAHDGTLAYIDDRGKFDFFYLKLIEGKPRLLFNLGNDRQALNVNTSINDDQWHTILIQRHGQITTLSIDHGRAHSSTMTNADDLYFGGSTQDEYDASPFYFGGIPSALERPSSGNLSSFDVYMQPRFRGQLRNVIYRNCADAALTQPNQTQMAGGISLIPDHYCSRLQCGRGLCLIEDRQSRCLCDETDYQGSQCHEPRQGHELTFDGKRYVKYTFNASIVSANEILTFQFKTDRHDGLLFHWPAGQFYVKLKQGQLTLEYRSNQTWYESSSKELYLVDNQWHFVQIQRKHGILTLLVDQNYLHLDNEIRIDQRWTFTHITLAGTDDTHLEKFIGCMKGISMVFNENFTMELHPTSSSMFSAGQPRNATCNGLTSPVQFLTSSSFISLPMPNGSLLTAISFRFQTYSSNSVLLYMTGQQQTNSDFLGLDLMDGFLSATVNMNKRRERQELFPQRFNDGQSHYLLVDLQFFQNNLDVNITVDLRHTTRMVIRNAGSKMDLSTLTVGGAPNPAVRSLPTNYWSGIMSRGLMGCFSDLELNHASIDVSKYINQSSSEMAVRSGACSASLTKKRECLCEHSGECRVHNSGSWSCDCSKTGYTGQRCEQLASHLDLSEIATLEVNTQLQWSEQISDIAFNLRAVHDEENFLRVRPCRLSTKCDSIDFSIRNGLLQILFHSVNMTSEQPFLLDNQWHSVRVQRTNTSVLLHVDTQGSQQRLPVHSSSPSPSATIWVTSIGTKQVLLEDLRIYEQSVHGLYSRYNQSGQMRFKRRSWKPTNTISLDNHQNSYLAIALNDLLCQECPLDAIHFQFRTKESNGLLLFANIQTAEHKISSPSDIAIPKHDQYLLLKLVNGQLHLTVVRSPTSKSDTVLDQVHAHVDLNDGHWHHISVYRASDQHLELTIDAQRYSLLTSIHTIDRLYFGRPSSLHLFNVMPTLKACFASLTLNRQPINLREYIKSNAQVRNDCFLDSQCPLRRCRNTGTCHERVVCQCQHTSFRGRFCTELRVGYAFDDASPGVIFNQPSTPDRAFSSYKLSFGLVTKLTTAEVIRINSLIQVELHGGEIRIKKMGNELIRNDQPVTDGQYHLVQIEYNATRYLKLSIDNKPVGKQLSHGLSVEKEVLLSIGQHPSFKYPFQGRLYGLESDAYAVFDLISPTFQRISFAPIRSPSSRTSSAILRPTVRTQDTAAHPSCSYQPYDDICIVTSDTNSSTLTYPNFNPLSSTPTASVSSVAKSSSSSSRSPETSTSLPRELLATPAALNSTNRSDVGAFVASAGASNSSRIREKLTWQNMWMFVVPALCCTVLCIIVSVLGFIKYRRKDVGVYEVEEAQRFRPLVVELSSSSGETNQEGSISTAVQSKTTHIKSHKRHKRKPPSTGRATEQREFYI